MRWTNDKPTRGGKYWARPKWSRVDHLEHFPTEEHLKQALALAAEVVDIVVGPDGEPKILNRHTGLHLLSADYQWAGPIPEPEE